MSINYYKLQGYKPFWIYHDDGVPKSHIETILENVSFNNKRTLKGLKKLTREMSNDEHWIPTKNYQWVDIFHVTATGTIDDIADYIKVDINGQVYYYYLISKIESATASKDNKTYYNASYQLDEYMTVYWTYLQLLVEHNPSVFVNMGFQNRYSKILDTEGNIDYFEINYLKQTYLGKTMQNRDNMLVRELAYYTNAQDIHDLNCPTPIPDSYAINRYDTGGDQITLTNFKNKLQTPKENGRYLYFIAKSSAKMKSANSQLLPAMTDQKFIIIPFFADQAADIWHALNDFDIATAGNVLNPSGSNEIGLWECDIPYSFFWGLVVQNKFGGRMVYAAQPMGSSQKINVPFFEFDNNSPIILKIIDYVKYRNGFYGKFLNMIENIYYWLPTTEPAMWNPSRYKEVYNNGEGEITIDASMFVFKWDSNRLDQFGIQAYLSLANSLILAYNFGDSTNTELASFDNTETALGSASITNLYMGSNSANFYTTSASAVATGLQNRQSEQAQAITDAALSTAQLWNAAAPTHWAPWSAAAQAIKGAVNATLGTAKIIADTAMEQARANRQFNASVNNITSSPNIALSDPSVKGVIPIKNGLFETYAKKLHPQDEKVEFSYITHNGYPINEMRWFNDVYDNRRFMNILNLDTTKYEDDIVRILSEYDNTQFRSKFWHKRFLAWLNSGVKVYDSYYFINVTDYEGEDYISNIEKELPDTPVPKDDIARFIKNFRIEYEANEDYIMNALMEDNPDAPEDIWENIYITGMQFAGFGIKALSGSEDYFGEIPVAATCYNGWILDGTTKHYFFDLGFLCGIPTNYTCPDGTTYERLTFNKQLYFIDNATISSIGDDFLRNAAYNLPLSLPNSIISIGNFFMGFCQSFNSTITLPNKLQTIGDNFMFRNYAFNKSLTLPNTLTSIGAGFMAGSWIFLQGSSSSTILYIQDLPASIFSTGEAYAGGTSFYTDQYITYSANTRVNGTNASALRSRFPDIGESGYYARRIRVV